MLYLWYVLFIGHSKVMAAVESALAHNKKIKFARCAGWDANMWAAHFVRILAQMPAPLI